MLQVNSENQAIAKQQHWESVGKHLPQGFVAATEPLDIPNLPLVKQIQADYAAAKPAMLRHMAQRKRLVLAKQMEIASRYNAEFERLHQHDAGATYLRVTLHQFLQRQAPCSLYGLLRLNLSDKQINKI